MSLERPSASPDVQAVDAQSPWPGLAAFTEDDRGYFHGREEAIEELHRLVRRERLTVLFGVSGLGKTSLLQAGLFPILRSENVLPVRVRLNYSSGAPELSLQIKQAVAAQATAARIDVPSFGGTLWEVFHRKDADFWSSRNRLVTPLLALDQFEEIFTRGRETPELARDTEKFLTELADLIEGTVPAAVGARIDAKPDEAHAFSFQRHTCKVLLSLREDFLADLEGLKHRLPSVMRNRLRLCPMTGEHALSALVRAGVDVIDEEVAARVIRFVGAEAVRGQTDLASLHVEPALLSVFCRELNLTRIERNEPKISAALLDGRQSEILTSFYERGLAGIGDPMRAFIEDCLVTLAGRRNSEPYDEALQNPGVTAADMSLLINRRILRIEDRAGMWWLELTHDKLTGIVCASREKRRQGEAQATAEAAERQAREELCRKSRTLRLVRTLLVAATLALVMAIGGGLFGLRQHRRAEAAAASQRDANRAARAALATTHFKEAVELVERNLATDALPYLSSAMRLDPSDSPVQAYTLSLLNRRNWPLPVRVIRGNAEFELVRLSPDRRLMVTAGRDGTAQVWEADTAIARGPPLVHRGVVTSVGFSRDSQRVVTASEDGTARFWDVATGRAIAPPLRHDDAVSWASLTDDGTRALTVSGDGAARLWDVGTGHMLFQLGSSHESVTVARLSRDGAYAVTGSLDGGARIWEVRTGTLIAKLTGHRKGRKINDAQFSPDGFRVATTSSDNTARLWDVYSGRLIGRPMNHDAVVWDVDFSPDGRSVATASDDGSVRVWSAKTGLPRTQPMLHASAVYTIEFSPDGRRIVSTAADYSARVWDVATGHPVTERMLHGDWLEATFDRDGMRVITASWDKTLRVWDVRPSASQPLPLLHAAHVVSARFSPKGDYVLTTSDDHVTRVWDTATVTPVSAPMKHAAEVIRAEFSGDARRVMTMTRNGMASVWYGSKWAQRDQLRVTRAMGFSADWTLALSAADREQSVQVVDVTGGTVGVPLREGSLIVAASISSDAKRAVTIGRDGRARLWDTSTGHPIGEFLMDRGGISSATFSPNGERLLTASRENTARVWDARTGRAIAGPLRHYDWVTSAAFNHEGSHVVTVSRDSAYIWDAQTGETIGQPLRHAQDVRSAQFSPDSRRIVTASDDCTARVWNVATGQPESEPLRHEGAVRHAEFNSSGTLIVTASDDGTARVWNLFNGSPDESGVLAPLAEVVGGSALNMRGMATQVADPVGQLSILRRQTGDARGRGVATFIRWFLADRVNRPSVPWATFHSSGGHR